MRVTTADQYLLIEKIQKHMDLYYEAILDGKGDREACIIAGIDPDKTPLTYGDVVKP